MEHAIGIDIGGTSTKIALVNSNGEVLAKASFPSHSPGGVNDFYPNLVKSITSVRKRFPSDLIGIGVGAPSCNENKGTIEGAANLPFSTSFPVVNLLKKTFRVPVFLTKDSNAALLGESRFGVARGIKNFVLLTLGTGLGNAMMLNGKLVKGGSGLAGEGGHIRLANNRRLCGCGKRGCLETYVSAQGIKRTLMALQAEELVDSSLRAYTFNQLTAQIIYEAAVAGDALACKAFEVTGRILGGKLAEMIALFEPEAIVLAGGMAKAGKLLTEPLQIQMEEDLLDFHKNKVRILITTLATNESALLGAASLAWDFFEQTKTSQKGPIDFSLSNLKSTK